MQVLDAFGAIFVNVQFRAGMSGSVTTADAIVYNPVFVTSKVNVTASPKFANCAGVGADLAKVMLGVTLAGTVTVDGSDVIVAAAPSGSV